MFQKGQSGNPAGPAKGTRHKITLLAEKLMQGDVENVVTAVVDAARKGDMTAAKIILDRIAPVRRDRPLGAAAPSVIPRRRDAQHIAHGTNLEGIALIFDKTKFHLGASEKMRSVFFRISRSICMLPLYWRAR